MPSSSEFLLTVLVPVFNEANHIQEVIEYLLASPCPMSREWIFIDDYSTDSSREILRSLQARHGFKLIEQPNNQGKGAAIIRGIQAASGDFIMIQDADYEYDPKDVPSLLMPFLENKADVVFGSRFKGNTIQVHRTYHYLVNRFLTYLSNFFSGVYLTDMETCYKIFRADLLQAMQLQSRRFGIEVELTAYVAKTAARICELPIHYYPRTRLQGKKIKWRDGIAALGHLIRFNFLTGVNQAFRNLPARYDATSNRSRSLQQGDLKILKSKVLPNVLKEDQLEPPRQDLKKSDLKKSERSLYGD